MQYKLFNPNQFQKSMHARTKVWLPVNHYPIRFGHACLRQREFESGIYKEQYYSVLLQKIVDSQILVNVYGDKAHGNHKCIVGRRLIFFLFVNEDKLISYLYFVGYDLNEYDRLYCSRIIGTIRSYQERAMM